MRALAASARLRGPAFANCVDRPRSNCLGQCDALLFLPLHGASKRLSGLIKTSDTDAETPSAQADAEPGFDQIYGHRMSASGPRHVRLLVDKQLQQSQFIATASRRAWSARQQTAMQLTELVLANDLISVNVVLNSLTETTGIQRISCSASMMPCWPKRRVAKRPYAHWCLCPSRSHPFAQNMNRLRSMTRLRGPCGLSLTSTISRQGQQQSADYRCHFPVAGGLCC